MVELKLRALEWPPVPGWVRERPLEVSDSISRLGKQPVRASSQLLEPWRTRTFQAPHSVPDDAATLEMVVSADCSSRQIGDAKV